MLPLPRGHTQVCSIKGRWKVPTLHQSSSCRAKEVSLFSLLLFSKMFLETLEAFVLVITTLESCTHWRAPNNVNPLGLNDKSRKLHRKTDEKETGYYGLDLYLAPWTQKHCRITEIKNRPEHPLHANARGMGEGRTNCS